MPESERTLEEIATQNGIHTYGGLLRTVETVLHELGYPFHPYYVRTLISLIEEFAKKAELKVAVENFFAQNIYKGYKAPFTLEDIRVSMFNENLFAVIPEGVREEIGKDRDYDWETRLSIVGKEFNAQLALPHWCYEK